MRHYLAIMSSSRGALGIGGGGGGRFMLGKEWEGKL